jgi:F0F1-type ATP synthase membrane subunit a
MPPVMSAKNQPVETPPPPGIRRTGLVFRTIFICILVVITARVASPEVEHVSSVYETPGDLIRVVLGFAVCVWLIVHLFVLPKDAAGYRTWFYMGFALIPLSILLGVVTW